MRVHRKRERKLRLDQRKKQEVLKRTGRLECEACAFEFEMAYGEWAEGPRINNLRKTQTQETREQPNRSTTHGQFGNCAASFVASRRTSRDTVCHALPSYGCPERAESPSGPLRTVS